MAIKFIGALSIEQAQTLSIKHGATPKTTVDIDKFMGYLEENVVGVKLHMRQIDLNVRLKERVTIINELVGDFFIIGVVKWTSVMGQAKHLHHVRLKGGCFVPHLFKSLCQEYWVPLKDDPVSYVNLRVRTIGSTEYAKLKKVN